MRPTFLTASLAIALLIGTLLAHQHYSTSQMNLIQLNVPNDQMPEDFPGLRVAVVGDLHVSDSPAAYLELELLATQVVAAKPDFIILLGDYTAHPNSITNLMNHRTEIAARLFMTAEIPIAAILGNYETWSGQKEWIAALSEAGLLVLNNAIQVISSGHHNFCVRGLGDAFTHQLKFVEFPVRCSNKLQMTLTHDPAGAFHTGVSGLIFAAHTHCGQIRIPGFGPLWMPTKAPRAATCGLYKDDTRVLWVTSGIGSSILPIRLGAQSQWDLITLRSHQAETH